MKKNVLTSSYALNFLGVLPFELVIKQNHLKSIFKILRFFRGTIILDQKYFLQFVKNFFNKRLQHLISVKADASYNIYQDNNKITLILYLRNIFKTVRLVLIILFASYFLGMFWYIYCDLTRLYIDDDTTDKFIDYFFIMPEGADPFNDPALADYKLKAAIIMTYYAFTTLSTVGLGDFHPRSNAERLLCAIILLVGSTMFSYIMGNFIDILYSLKNINVDFKDELMLTKFMGSLTRFNGG